MFLCVSTQLESFLSHKKLKKSFKLLVFILEYDQHPKNASFQQFMLPLLPIGYCLLPGFK
jgi:hypothetical protein